MMRNPRDAFVHAFEKELDMYERTSEKYWLSVNPKRKIQVYIARTVIEKIKLKLLSIDQARSILYALADSMPESARSFGFGSQLKYLLEKYSKAPEIVNLHELYYAESLNHHEDQNVYSAENALFRDTIATPTDLATADFIDQFCHIKLKSGAYKNHACAIPIDIFKNIIVNVRAAASEISDNISTDVIPGTSIRDLDDSCSDLFFNDFQPIPLKLVLKHSRSLYQLLLKKRMDTQGITEMEARTLSLSLLPDDIRADFITFIDSEDFFDEIELYHYFKPASALAHDYVHERLDTAATDTPDLHDVVRKTRQLKSKVASIIKGVYYLSAQFKPEDAKLLLSDQHQTSFENLIGYVASLNLVVDKKEHKELLERQTKILDRYHELRDKSALAAARILDYLRENGYAVDTGETIDVIAILKQLNDEESSPLKRKLLRGLNSVNASSRSLLEDLKIYIDTGFILKRDAISLTQDALATCIHQESSLREAKQIDLALRLKLKEAMQAHFKFLFNQQYRPGSSYRPYLFRSSSLKTEREAFSIALDDAMRLFSASWSGIVQYRPHCKITETAAGSLSISFDILELNLPDNAMIGYETLNRLLTHTDEPMRECILATLREGVHIDAIQVASLEPSGILKKRCDSPTALSYRSSCNVETLHFEALPLPDSSLVDERYGDIEEIYARVMTVHDLFKDTLSVVRADDLSLKKIEIKTGEARYRTADGVDALLAAKDSSYTPSTPRSIKTSKRTSPSSSLHAECKDLAKEALIKIIEAAAQNYYERYGAHNENKIFYARTQLEKKFQGICKIRFVRNKVELNLNFDSTQENINAFLKRILHQLDLNNTHWSAFNWNGCATSQFIKNKLAAEGLRDLHGNLLGRYEQGHITLVPQSARAPYSMPFMATANFRDTPATPASSVTATLSSTSSIARRLSFSSLS